MSDQQRTIAVIVIGLAIAVALMLLTGKLTREVEIPDMDTQDVVVGIQDETPAPSTSTDGAGGKSMPAPDANTHIPAHDASDSASPAGDVNTAPSDCPSCQSQGRFFRRRR